MCFDDVLDLCVVYISEKDFLKGGMTIYHVDKVLRETGAVVDDGLQEIVDAEVREAERKAISDLIKLGIPKEKILGLNHSEELYEEVLAELQATTAIPSEA